MIDGPRRVVVVTVAIKFFFPFYGTSYFKAHYPLSWAPMTLKHNSAAQLRVVGSASSHRCRKEVIVDKCIWMRTTMIWNNDKLRAEREANTHKPPTRHPMRHPTANLWQVRECKRPPSASLSPTPNKSAIVCTPTNTIALHTRVPQSYTPASIWR
ncbi:hypothetical protein FIBSPDRAFT_445549 [Athelia psychrophila]|uniref:Uncharacterized protein n=1 Tax=Athelia psychrophila TaxID=1759441 RepID=A0A166M9I2_9AGAM|nr:hypothetical protein FIBSPDRAFT_445549 [Fibularhizoctonia sp. CBS 109695]